MDRRQLLALLIAVCCFTLIQPVQRRLNEVREREGLVQSAADIIEVTGNVALAGWRAVVTDVFWVKVDALQNQGKLENILWFLTAITKLQPDLPEVWDFISWHVAYNLFHEVESREDKWAFLSRGLDLGEEGVRKNPKDSDLWYSLGYRYYHKFDDHFFPDFAYFRKRFREKTGRDNYDVAIDRVHHSTALVTNEIHSRFACHIYDRWVLTVYMEGDLEKSLKLAEEAVELWDSVFKEFDVHGQAVAAGVDLNKNFLDEARTRGLAIGEDLAAAAAEKSGDLRKALGLYEESVKLWDKLAKSGGLGSRDERPRNRVAGRIADLKKKLGAK
jgi:tetratricopeptide (TPR) repeat protein